MASLDNSVKVISMNVILTLAKTEVVAQTKFTVSLAHAQVDLLVKDAR